MTAKLYLRIAAIFVLLHTIGHTLGTMTWKEAPTPGMAVVISGMQSQYFDFFGKSVSMGMFFEGYGVTMTFVLLAITIMLWLLSGDEGSKLGFKMTIVLSVLLLAMAVIEYFYFFAIPTACSFLATVFTGLGVFKMRPVKL